MCASRQRSCPSSQVSMLSCIFLGHIFHRNQAIQPNVAQPHILIGDPYQIPPTGSTPFYETLIRHYVEKRPCEPSSPGPIPNPGSFPFTLLSPHIVPRPQRRAALRSSAPPFASTWPRSSVPNLVNIQPTSTPCAAPIRMLDQSRSHFSSGTNFYALVISRTIPSSVRQQSPWRQMLAATRSSSLASLLTESPVTLSSYRGGILSQASTLAA